jgi:hypothetical protein
MPLHSVSFRGIDIDFDGQVMPIRSNGTSAIRFIIVAGCSANRIGLPKRPPELAGMNIECHIFVIVSNCRHLILQSFERLSRIGEILKPDRHNSSHLISFDGFDHSFR